MKKTYRSWFAGIIPGVAMVTMLVSPGQAAPPVTSGLTLQLDATVGVETNASGVTAWRDQSGLTHDALQGTASDEPSLVSNGINGLPSLGFDGTNDRLLISSLVQATMITVSNYTTFSVWKAVAIDTDSGQGWANDAIFMDGGGGFFGLAVRSTGPKLQAYNWHGNNAVAETPFTLGTPVLATTMHVTNYLYSSVYGGGSASVSSPNTQAPSDAGLRIGEGNSSQYFNGQIAEILIYNRVLSPSEVTSVQSYLNAKWLIPEPQSFALVGLSVAFLWNYRRRYS